MYTRKIGQFNRPSPSEISCFFTGPPVLTRFIQQCVNSERAHRNTHKTFVPPRFNGFYENPWVFIHLNSIWNGVIEKSMRKDLSSVPRRILMHYSGMVWMFTAFCGELWKFCVWWIEEQSVKTKTQASACTKNIHVLLLRMSVLIYPGRERLVCPEPFFPMTFDLSVTSVTQNGCWCGLSHSHRTTVL